MRRKIFSIITALALCLGLLPGTALAAEGDSPQPEDKSGGLIFEYSSNMPKVETVYTAGSGTITWTPQMVGEKVVSGTLTLNNANIDAASGSGIKIPASATVVLMGENNINITASNGTGIRAEDVYSPEHEALTIQGPGSLAINSTGYGIFAQGDVTIKDKASVTINISTQNACVYSNLGNIYVKDSTVKAKTVGGPNSAYAPLTSNKESILIENSHVVTISSAGYAIQAITGDVQLTNSDVVAIGNGVSTAINFSMASGIHFQMNGGTLYVKNASTEVGDYDLPSYASMRAVNGAVIFYGNEYYNLISEGDNIQYINCVYDEATDKVTTIGNGYVLGNMTWNDNVVFPNASTTNKDYIYGRNYINGKRVYGTITIPDGREVTIPAGKSIYCYSLVNNGTIHNAGDLYHVSGYPLTNNGTLNGLVRETSEDKTPADNKYTAYGNAQAYQNLLAGGNASIYQPVIIPSGTTLTIPQGKTLDASNSNLGVTWATLETYLSVQGQLIVNGTLKLPPTPDQKKLTELLAHISGTGQILIDGTQIYNVTFDTQGGSPVENQAVAVNGNAIEPDPEPTRPGHAFDGWYTDVSGTSVYNFDTIVTASLTLYAKWTPIEYTIIFNALDGSDPDSVQADYGTQLTQPADPTRDGYTFGGWYTDEGCTTVYDFNAPVTGNLTLYAKWTQDSGNEDIGHIPTIPVIPDTPSAPSTTPSTPDTPSLPVTTNTTTQGSTPTTQTTATPPAAIRDGEAAAAVDAAMGSEIVRQAVSNSSESVVIAPEVPGDVTRTEVSIPASTVGQIGSQTSASLTVSTPVADVTIPNGGLASLAGAGGIVTVTAGQTGNTVELSVTADGKPVAHVPGGVTLTVPMEDPTPGTVAVLIHEDGTQETIRKSVAKGDSVTIPLEGSAKVVLLDNGKRFDDVPAASWAADAIAFVSARDLFSGAAPGRFSPDVPMTRAMLAVALHNLENNPAQPFTGAFTDVEDSHWYAEGVSWAAANGIVSGYGDGRFGPDDSITREQLAVILWRYAGSPVPAEKSLPFADAGKVSAWAEEALRWAVERGILKGSGGGILDPTGPATRAETAQMLMNFLGK